jgi:hypothetical protein
MTWLVDAVPVDRRQAAASTRRSSVRANDRGDFEFVGLQPGAYLIGVNLLRPASPGEPYPPTYFPGTIDPGDAIPIGVGEGTVHEGVDLRLQDPILKGQLQIRVESDGGPGDVSVCLRNVSSAMENPGGSYTPSGPGEPVTITVLEGARYQLVAHVERRASHSESEVVEVTGDMGRQTLTLKANAQAPRHSPGFGCQPFFSH